MSVPMIPRGHSRAREGSQDGTTSFLFDAVAYEALIVDDGSFYEVMEQTRRLGLAVKRSTPRDLRAAVAPGLIALAIAVVHSGCGAPPVDRGTASGHTGTGDVRLDSVNASMNAGRLVEARRQVMDALRVARDSASALDEANSLLVLGRVELESKDWKAARAAFGEARVLYQRLGDVVGEGVALLGGGRAAVSAGDQSEALVLYATAAAHGKKWKEAEIEADSWLGIGMIEAEQRPAVAREAFIKAARLYRRAGLGAQSRGALALAEKLEK